MRIEKFQDSLGRHILRGAADHDDATPKWGDIVFDAWPRHVGPERLGLASFLFFGRYAGAHLEVLGALHPATAEVASRGRDPYWLGLAPVDYRPRDVPSGNYQIELAEWSSVRAPLEAAPMPDGQLIVARSDRLKGDMGGVLDRIVVTNAMVCSSEMSPEEHLERLTAVGVLFAEHLEAKTLIVRLAQSVGLSRTQWLRALLRTVGLNSNFTIKE